MQPSCTSLALHPHLDLLNNDHDNFKDLEHYYAGDDVDNLSLGNSPPSLFISARNRCAHLYFLFLLSFFVIFCLFIVKLMPAADVVKEPQRILFMLQKGVEYVQETR